MRTIIKERAWALTRQLQENIYNCFSWNETKMYLRERHGTLRRLPAGFRTAWLGGTRTGPHGRAFLGRQTSRDAGRAGRSVRTAGRTNGEPGAFEIRVLEYHGSFQRPSHVLGWFFGRQHSLETMRFECNALKKWIQWRKNWKLIRSKATNILTEMKRIQWRGKSLPNKNINNLKHNLKQHKVKN